MGSDEGRHLTASDCESLLVHSPGADALREELAAHLKGCARCGKLMEHYRVQSKRVAGLRVSAGARAGADCPDAERWLRLAAGLEQEPAAGGLLDHASTCDACGAFFKFALEDLNAPELPPEAESAAGPEFGRRVAAQLRAQREFERRTPAPRARWRWAVLLGVAAAAVLVLLLLRPAWIFGQSPEQMLAQAYESDRAWTVRFPGAAYVPQTAGTRAASARNTPLAEAEAAISRGLDRDPNEPRWIQLHARAEFLRHRYDSAIETLRPLAESGDSPSVWADLGAAYAARGLADGTAEDLENAIDDLSRALDANPDDPLALFNRALALEAASLWDRAEEDWNHYLRLDPQSGWAGEARRHLQDIAQKKTSGGTN